MKYLMLRAQHRSTTCSAEIDVGRVSIVQPEHSKIGESYWIRLHDLRINVKEVHRFFQISHRCWRLPVRSDVSALEAFGTAQPQRNLGTAFGRVSLTLPQLHVMVAIVVAPVPYVIVFLLLPFSREKSGFASGFMQNLTSPVSGKAPTETCHIYPNPQEGPRPLEWES